MFTVSQQYPSAQLLRSRPTSPQPYILMTIAQKTYRILNKQINCKRKNIQLWYVIWLESAFMTLIWSLSQFIQIQIPISRLVIMIAILLLNCLNVFRLVVINLKCFLSILPYTLALICIVLSILVILLALNISWSTIPISIYILIQIGVSYYLMEKKKYIILKVLAYIQLIIITLRVDNILNAPWTQTLFGLNLCLIFLTASILFFLIYIIFQKLWYPLSFDRYKDYGLIFLVLNLTAICILLTIPVGHVYISINSGILTIISVPCLILIAFYIWKFQRKIALFFCQLIQIKAYNQQITVTVNEDFHQDKLLLYQLSSNWFSITRPQHNKQIDKFNNDCLVCMENAPVMVWMPCGHLAVCHQCCQFMFFNKNINCILCKKLPRQIYQIQKIQANECEIECQNQKNQKNEKNENKNQLERKKQKNQSSYPQNNENQFDKNSLNHINKLVDQNINQENNVIIFSEITQKYQLIIKIIHIFNITIN